jgi:hypothetical protein
MKPPISEIQKRRRGRPATGRDPAVAARIPKKVLAVVDKWAFMNDVPTRAGAIRRLVELGSRQRSRQSHPAKLAADPALPNLPRKRSRS